MAVPLAGSRQEGHGRSHTFVLAGRVGRRKLRQRWAGHRLEAAHGDSLPKVTGATSFPWLSWNLIWLAARSKLTQQEFAVAVEAPANFTWNVEILVAAVAVIRVYGLLLGVYRQVKKSVMFQQ